MSEYQYYEFRAIDRPLDQDQMDELRRLSSRAEITPTSLTNTYHYGDFRGNINALMDRYFDAFVYVANWGTRRLMFRFPRSLLDVETAGAYEVEDSFSVEAGKDHVVVEFSSDDEGSGEWTDGEPWMPSLVPLRDEILRGDRRAFYLSWLASVWAGDREPGDPDEAGIEPPVPPGLAKLSGPLRSLAEFLRIDDELIEAAAQANDGDPPAEPSRHEFARWVKKLPVADKDDCLMRLIDGERDALILADLSRRYREETLPKKAGRRAVPGGERRTVARLLEISRDLAAENRRKAAEKAAREKAARDRERAKERASRLDQLSKREAETWREVGKLLATTVPKNYDRAVELLVDLRDLARRDGRLPEVSKRLERLRHDHRTKPSLMKRFDKEKLG